VLTTNDQSDEQTNRLSDRLAADKITFDALNHKQIV